MYTIVDANQSKYRNSSVGCIHMKAQPIMRSWYIPKLPSKVTTDRKNGLWFIAWYIHICTTSQCFQMVHPILHRSDKHKLIKMQSTSHSITKHGSTPDLSAIHLHGRTKNNQGPTIHASLCIPHVMVQQPITTKPICKQYGYSYLWLQVHRSEAHALSGDTANSAAVMLPIQHRVAHILQSHHQQSLSRYIQNWHSHWCIRLCTKSYTERNLSSIRWFLR